MPDDSATPVRALTPDDPAWWDVGHEVSPPSDPEPPTNVALSGSVTPATIAALVADGSAAALKYLRLILDDTKVDAALRIKAAQSLLGTLPKQINVSSELVVSARSYDALMAQATALLAARGVGAGVDALRGNVIDVQAEAPSSAAA